MTSRHFALLRFRFWQSSNRHWTRDLWGFANHQPRCERCLS